MLQGVFKRVFKGELEGDLVGDLKGDFEVDFEVDLEGDFRGDFKQDLEGDLLSSSGQLRSRSGLVQVWFSIELKFNSFELDSEVGRLVYLKYRSTQIKYRSNQIGTVNFNSFESYIFC